MSQLNVCVKNAGRFVRSVTVLMSMYEDLVAGSGAIAFGQAIRFVDPRRFFLGARINF